MAMKFHTTFLTFVDIIIIVLLGRLQKYSKKQTLFRFLDLFCSMECPSLYLYILPQDPLAEVNMFSGLSKFAKIAWSLTRCIASYFLTLRSQTKKKCIVFQNGGFTLQPILDPLVFLGSM